MKRKGLSSPKIALVQKADRHLKKKYSRSSISNIIKEFTEQRQSWQE